MPILEVWVNPEQGAWNPHFFLLQTRGTPESMTGSAAVPVRGRPCGS